MTRNRPHLAWFAAAALAVTGLAACGIDDDSAPTPSTTLAPTPTTVAPPPSTSPATPTVPTNPPAPPTTVAPAPPAPPTTADNGGGGMQAGAPQFQSFNVSSSAQCQDGNATAQMSFSTLNVVEIEIKIGSGKFQTTAGYGPDESDVIATIPCNGAGVSSVQLRGCTENHTCTDSAQQAVQITA